MQLIESHLRIEYQCGFPQVELRSVTSKGVGRWYNEDDVLFIQGRHLAHESGLAFVPEPFPRCEDPWQRCVRRQQHVSILRQMILEVAKPPVKVLLAVADEHVLGRPRPSNRLETRRQISIVLADFHSRERQPW